MLEASGSGWLVGKAYSIADIGAAPFVMRISELNAPALAEHPLVTDWWARVQARPSFTTARIEAYIESAAKDTAKK